MNSMRSEIIEKITAFPCWQGELDIAPLSGGMTNLNFRVVDNGKKYVVRLGESAPEHLLWRKNEEVSSRIAAHCGFSPRVIHHEDGVLVIEFIDGKVFTEKDVRDPNNLSRIISTLKRFHHEMPKYFDSYPVMFWVFQTVRHYRNMLEQGGSAYMDQVSRLMQIAAALEKAVGAVDIVFTHNDLLAANLIDDGEKVWIIDFDYAGFNSPLFDLSNLASNSELDESSERLMLVQYFDTPVSDRLWHQYSAMKCASLLRELMWSMISEIHSKIEFDYVPYTSENSRRFEAVYQNYRQNFS